MRALDRVAELSMAAALDPLGRETPPVLTYLGEGLGAQILKAGIRHWDGSLSPAAAIKVTRHNLYRPTSLVHETGHQVAHILGWNPEVAGLIERGLAHAPALGELWASWVSEITADAFAFAHCGYPAVAALHDVLANDVGNVLRVIPGDPHPVAYLRVLLGVQMCRRSYGSGPWDELASAWMRTYPLTGAAAVTKADRGGVDAAAGPAGRRAAPPDAAMLRRQAARRVDRSGPGQPRDPAMARHLGGRIAVYLAALGAPKRCASSP